MKTREEKYFKYLTTRSKLSLFLRRLMYTSVIKEFKGKLLDVGCGIGEFLQWYPNSFGIDTNRFLVKYCKERGINCIYGSIYKIPFKKSMFDTVLCSHLMEHLSKPDMAMKEIRRVLKKAGKLIIIVPTEKGYKRDKTHVKFWDKENIGKLLEKHGFKIKKLTYYPKLLNKYTVLGELRIVAVKTR